ncbi:MAG: hypothetical protein IKO47_05135 [Ruminococcus sp.]|nr:hypothetical protein [Ruminococcus sp.]
MRQDFSIEKFLRKMKSDKFIAGIGMPMEYAPGLPVIRRINDTDCITVPFLRRRRAKKTVREDGSRFTVIETYPIRYAVTYALRPINLPELKGSAAIVMSGDPEFLDSTITEGRPIAFEDLSFRSDYTVPGSDKKFDPRKPVGVFAPCEDYEKKLGDFYKLFDEAVNIRLYEKTIDGALENRLINRLSELLNCDKALRPFYALLDNGHHGKRIAEQK